MTVAAGFTFGSGVLICADTQFTSSSVKFNATKIVHASASGQDQKEIESVFAMSGTDGHMQTAVSACERAIANDLTDRDPDELGFDAVKDCLEKALVDVYEKHFFRHKHYGYVGGPEVSLIVGVLVPDHNAYLYWTQETTVNEIEEYMFVGSGADIARYVTEPLLIRNRDMTLDEVMLLATHALRTAKASDPHTGGTSEFSVLYDGTRNPKRVEKFDISNTEAYSKTFESIVRDLFYASADWDAEQSGARFATWFADQKLTLIREEQKDQKLKRDRLLAALRKPL